jgi:signal transduction histidine kinase/CheY-like chemotaxis protein
VTTPPPAPLEQRRVLVLAPTALDASITTRILGDAGIACTACPTLDAVAAELERGAAAVLLTEEFMAQGAEALTGFIARQAPWSDLPVLLLARSGADSPAVARAMHLLGNVTVLERPVRVAALVSTVRTALRARERQYQARAHFADQQRATEALRETEAELRLSDRRKDDFLAILAHELRNPLAPIRNAVQILRLSGRLDAETAEVGAMMERQVNHMVRLVDDLMDVSRVTRGKVQLHKRAVDAATVVRNALETSRLLLDAFEHTVALDLPPDALMLDGDPVRLTQVVANLLNNAAKYTAPGGRIVVAARREGGDAVVSVRDSGIGIPAGMLAAVFEPFAQVEHHAARAQGGLGIGLTLVKHLVELHGGSVRAFSDGEGRGSEFVLRLPLLERREGERDLECAVAPAVALVPRDILVVDDNRDAADSLHALLKLLGADVRVAYSGAEALAAIAARVPAAVLLDIGMPGMDGHEVARRVRLDPALAGVALIALTGWGQEQDRHRSRDSGFDHHLVKPLDLPMLQAMLSSLDAPERPSMRAA